MTEYTDSTPAIDPAPSLVTTTHVTYALHAVGLALGASTDSAKPSKVELNGADVPQPAPVTLPAEMEAAAK